MRNGRGGACVPARTSAQRRFHPQKGTSPPVRETFPSAKGASPSVKEAFPCVEMFAHDAHSLSMDAPLQGDTGRHTGAAPTNLHQTPLPRNLPRFCPSAEPLPAIITHVCPSANCSPATLGHGVTRGMVGAAPVCPPERPRSGVSIRKEHIPHPAKVVSPCVDMFVHCA